MSNELKITDVAREAVRKEFVDARIGNITGTCEYQRGHFVQLAINSTCAELRAENERLKKELYKTHTYAAKQAAESDCGKESAHWMGQYMKMQALYTNASKQCDQLLAREKELREIADELADNLRAWHKQNDCEIPDCDCIALTRYTTFLAANPEGGK